MSRAATNIGRNTGNMGRLVFRFARMVCDRMTRALSARRPFAGAVPGRWGACLAVRTPPAAFVRSGRVSPWALPPLPTRVTSEPRIKTAPGEHRRSRLRSRLLLLLPRRRGAFGRQSQQHAGLGPEPLQLLIRRLSFLHPLHTPVVPLAGLVLPLQLPV